MKNKLLVIFPLIIAIGMGACSSEAKTENRKMKAQLIQLQKKNDDLKSNFNEISSKYRIKNDNVKKQTAKIKILRNGEEFNKYDILSIYNMNYEVDSIESEFYISMPKEKELADKLKLIAKELSQKYFWGYPIEILNIENADNKKIVYINLINKKDDRTANLNNWYHQFFSRSSSNKNYNILIENFLQRKYQGQWIDGVVFFYDGVIPKFPDMPYFSEVKYRN